MKKRILSFLLTIAMVFTLAPAAFAVPGDEVSGYAIRLSGTSGTTIGSKNMPHIELKLQLKGDAIAGESATVAVNIKIDTTKLKLVRYTNGNDVSPGSTGFGTVTGAGFNLDATVNGYVSSANVMGRKDDSKNLLYLGMQAGFAETVSDWNTTYGDTMAIRLAFVNGATVDDLDSTSISLVTVDESYDLGQNNVAELPSGSDSYVYEVNKRGTPGKDLPKPIIIVDGKELPTASTPITGITVTLGNGTLAVPTAAQKTATTTATAKAQPDDATLPADLKWSIEPAYTGVSIDNAGKITVSPSAAAGSVTVKAASASKALNGTATLTLTKAAAAAETVTVSPTSGTATLKASGGADTVNATVTVKDQYGATMSGKTPTVSGNPAGVSWASNKFTFTNDARATTGAQKITFTVDGKTATFDLTIKKGTQSAPTTPTGVKTSAVGSSDGKITGVTTAMEYKKQGDASYTAITGTEVTGLAKGTYLVRYKATDYLDVSPDKTVSVGEPGKTDDPTVTITPATVELAEGGSQVLTANVTPATGTITYKWYKDNVEISGETGATLTVNDAGTYKVEVTRQAAGESVSNAVTATATVTVKGKTVATVTKKTTASQSAGALNVEKLVTVTGVTWNDVKDLVTATVYKEVVGEDGSKTYEVVTGSLAEGTYYVDIDVAAAGADAAFKLDAVPGAGAPTDPITVANYVKLTVTKGGSGIVIGGGSATSSYTVKFNAGANGTISGTTSVKVKKGETVETLPTVTANEGYKFRGWSVDGKTIVDPTTVEITKNTTFTALFTAVKNTYISGYPDSSFRPDATVTRAEIASMLARLSKDFNADATYTGSANDVVATAWYANAVNFGMQKGIISGHQDGGFHPDANITRAEFASMLARYLGLNAGSKTFADTADHWAKDSIAALADAGIVTGRPNGGFDPNASLTRAEAVQMINTALKVSSVGVEYEVVPNDVASTHWAYNQILTAMNTDIKDIVK